MRVGPQTRGPALMRGGSRILARNNFAGRAKRGAGQCGAGWPALPPLIFLPHCCPQLCLSPLRCHHPFKYFLPLCDHWSFNTFATTTLPLRCHCSSSSLPPILPSMRLHSRTTLHSFYNHNAFIHAPK